MTSEAICSKGHQKQQDSLGDGGGGAVKDDGIKVWTRAARLRVELAVAWLEFPIPRTRKKKG